MKIDIQDEIIIDDIPHENRKTKEPSPLFEIAKYIDDCLEQGTPATGAQTVFKLAELVGGDRIDIPQPSTLVRNISLRLYPIK